MAPSEKEDRARALRALLVMIDSQEYDLATREDRDTNLEYLIEQNELTCWTGSWNNRNRVSYPKSQLLAQFSQLTKFLKDGVQETKPKTEVLWLFGSSVIKPDYLKKHLLYDIEATTDDNLERNRFQTANSGETHNVPEACCGISGSVECEGATYNKLFHAGGGFYCRPCVDYAIDEEDNGEWFGGCSNPFKSPKCKGTQLNKPNFYDDRVLCSLCKSLVVKEEKSKAAAEATALPSTEQDVIADSSQPVNRDSNASMEIVGESIAYKPEQPLSMPQSGQAAVETVMPHIVDLEPVNSSSSNSNNAAPGVHDEVRQETSPSDGTLHKHYQMSTISNSTRKRAAEVPASQPVEAHHKRPRLPVHDELHQTGDSGVAVAHCQKEMGAIWAIVREIVMIFHLENKLDPNEPARLLERDRLSRYPTLKAAYRETIGLEEGRWCKLSLDNSLTSGSFLTALLGAMINQQVFPVDLSILSAKLPDSLAEALRADLGLDDEDFTSFQARLRFREVQSNSFQHAVNTLTAPNATGKILLALEPQFRLMTTTEQQHIPGSKWFEEFRKKLIRAIKKAFLLKARLQVAPGRYAMTWYASDSYFDRTMMEAKEAPAEGEYRIVTTLLPGWKLKDPAGDESRDEVVVKATVRLGAVMSGEPDTAEHDDILDLLTVSLDE